MSSSRSSNSDDWSDSSNIESSSNDHFMNVDESQPNEDELRKITNLPEYLWNDIVEYSKVDYKNICITSNNNLYDISNPTGKQVFNISDCDGSHLATIHSKYDTNYKAIALTEFYESKIYYIAESDYKVFVQNCIVLLIQYIWKYEESYLSIGINELWCDLYGRCSIEGINQIIKPYYRIDHSKSVYIYTVLRPVIPNLLFSNIKSKPSVYPCTVLIKNRRQSFISNEDSTDPDVLKWNRKCIIIANDRGIAVFFDVPIVIVDIKCCLDIPFKMKINGIHITGEEFGFDYRWNKYTHRGNSGGYYVAGGRGVSIYNGITNMWGERRKYNYGVFEDTIQNSGFNMIDVEHVVEHDIKQAVNKLMSLL